MEPVANHTQVDPGPERRTRLAVAWLSGLGVFLLALLPRILDLSAIITPDERRWVERSVAFFTSLVEHDWASTFQTGQPRRDDHVYGDDRAIRRVPSGSR